MRKTNQANITAVTARVMEAPASDAHLLILFGVDDLGNRYGGKVDWIPCEIGRSHPFPLPLRSAGLSERNALAILADDMVQLGYLRPDEAKQIIQAKDAYIRTLEEQLKFEREVVRELLRQRCLEFHHAAREEIAKAISDAAPEKT